MGYQCFSPRHAIWLFKVNPNKAFSHGHHFFLQDCKDPRRSDLTDRDLPAHIVVSWGLFLPSFPLLISQCFHRIYDRCTDRLVDGRRGCDEYDDTGGEREEPWADGRAVGEILQPFVHSQPGEGCGDQYAYGDEAAEVF